MIQRKTAWDAELRAYLDDHRTADKPCAYFAAGAVEAMTGEDLLAKFRGRMKWASEHLAEAVDEVLERRPVPFARAGDLVMLSGNLGVCNGALSYFMAEHEGQSGTTTADTLTCDAAWTVG